VIILFMAFGLLSLRVHARTDALDRTGPLARSDAFERL
jgi:hypothetical protein